VYADRKALLIAGLHDNTTKAIKKGELKDSKQEPGERVRDFQTRIDDMYRIAYGAGPATSNDPNVVCPRRYEERNSVGRPTQGNRHTSLEQSGSRCELR
jgi:hypothetical protein